MRAAAGGSAINAAVARFALRQRFRAARALRALNIDAAAFYRTQSNVLSTDGRKSLLIDFADLRGSMAMAIGAIRAYLLTADAADKQDEIGLMATPSLSSKRT
ncbi:hypothetical protein [Bradyrhizobium sp. STM 3562]|uniref:hypothetical protein n=1 Tax=Bradyrhizobium sp. STM 3562 TaxID=578924 RepID=UPI00388E4C2B